MNRKLLYISTVIVLILLTIKIFSDNKSWVIKLYMIHGENQTRNLIYIKGENMKIISEDKTYLYNSDSKIMSFINPKTKSYWSGKIEKFTQAVTKLKMRTEYSFLINDVSFLRNLNTLNKTHFDKIINRKSRKSSLIPDYNIFNNFNIKSTPNFTSVGGYAVRKYEITNSGKLLEEIWIAENLLTHIGWNMEDFKEFLDAYFFQSGISPFFNLNAYMEARKNGLPMKVIVHNNNQKREVTMEHVARKKLDNKVFSIPKDFERQSLEKMMNINF